MAISVIVSRYLDQSELTLREFAEELARSFPGSLTHATVINWRDGNSEPQSDFLLRLFVFSGDGWRRRFALDCLRAKLPELEGLWALMEEGWRNE